MAEKKDMKNTLWFFIIIFIYKITLELGFWYLLQKTYADANIYQFEFNYVKYLLGMFWCILLFFMINHEERRPSTFFSTNAVCYSGHTHNSDFCI